MSIVTATFSTLIYSPREQILHLTAGETASEDATHKWQQNIKWK